MRISNREEFFGCLVIYEAIGGILLAVGMTSDEVSPWIGAIFMAFFAIVGITALPGVLREPRYYVDIGKRAPTPTIPSSGCPSRTPLYTTPSTAPIPNRDAQTDSGDGTRYDSARYNSDGDRCTISDCDDRAEIGPWCGPHSP